MMGNSLNLSPLVIILSLTIWGSDVGRGRNVPLRTHDGHS